MADIFRDRSTGMAADGESTARHAEMRQRWEKFVCTTENAVPIVELVTRHYRGGRQRPVKLHNPIRGGYNANWRVEFENGSAMLHVPVPGNSAFFDEKIRAEVATMRMIEARTTIPVPHIYHWGYAADNPVGLGPFIIMDYIEHASDLSKLLMPADEPGWDIDLHGIGPGICEDTLLKVYRQMANILLQLSTLEMPCIGSPKFQGNSQAFQIQGRPITQNMTEMIVGGGNPHCTLPAEKRIFATTKEYYSALSDSE